MAQPLSLTAPEKLATLEAFQRLQTGIPPSTDVAEKNKIFGRMQTDLTQAEQHLNNQNSQSSDKCERFISTSGRLVEDLRSGVRSLTVRHDAFVHPPLSDFDFELANHVRIAGAAFSEMAFLLNQKAEGGYSVLDSHNTTSCPLADRDGMITVFNSTVADLGELFKTVLGVPGIDEMENSQQRLLHLAIDDERFDRKKFWGAMAGLTAASVVFWEFSPAIAAGTLRLLWGYTPRIFAIPAFLYGVKVSALVAEGMVFTYADHWTSSRVLPPKIFLGSWDEHMDSIETFIKSPIHVPELELVFLSRIHAVMLAESMQWFAPANSFLKEAEQKSGSIAKAIDYYQNLNRTVPHE